MKSNQAEEFLTTFHRMALPLLGFSLLIATLNLLALLTVEVREPLFPPADLPDPFPAPLGADHINLLFLGTWFAIWVALVATAALRRRERWAYKTWVLLLGICAFVCVCELMRYGIAGAVSLLPIPLVSLFLVALLLRRFLADDVRAVCSKWSNPT
jgi:hypothetical protein